MIQYIIIFIVVQLFILIPSFFWYRKVVNKFNIKRVKLLSIIVTLAMPIIYTTIFVSIGYAIVDPIIRSKKFEKKEWIKNIDSRYRMVDDLTNNDLLIGKNKDEIIRILGNDFSENCWGKNTLCYVAPDPDNYAFLDHYEFVIYLDNSKTVVRVSFELI